MAERNPNATVRRRCAISRACMKLIVIAGLDLTNQLPSKNTLPPIPWASSLFALQQGSSQLQPANTQVRTFRGRSLPYLGTVLKVLVGDQLSFPFNLEAVSF